MDWKGLEAFPLARRYGWRADRSTTGGSLYLFPPRSKYPNDYSGTNVIKDLLKRTGLESINPDDLHRLAGTNARWRHTVDEAEDSVNVIWLEKNMAQRRKRQKIAKASKRRKPKVVKAVDDSVALTS